MGDRDQGAAGAVGEFLGELAERVEGARAAATGEQLQLIGLPEELTSEGAARARASAASGRAGRPAGAQNLATREVKDFCRRLFGYDPLVEGFRWAQHTPESLAIALGCTRLEAYDRLERLRADLARYFYAPMQPIGEDGKPVPFFQMVIGGNQVGGAPGGPPWIYAGGPVLRQVEQKQGLGDQQNGASHEAPSHREVK